MSHHIYRQITSSDNTFRIFAIFLEDSIQFSFFQNGKGWKSSVLLEELSTIASQHQLKLRDYISKLSKYLAKERTDIHLSFVEGEFAVIRMIDDKIKLKYFINKPNEVAYHEHIEDLLENIYLEEKKSNEHLLIVNQQVEVLETQNKDFQKEINEIIVDQKRRENELYGQFLLVLNEKKIQIQHLTELLEAFRAGHFPTSHTVTVQNNSRTHTKKETISESESSTESYHTEEDNQEDEPTCSNTERPSTSTQNFDFLEELDDLNEEIVLPKRAKSDQPKAKINISKSKPTIKSSKQNVSNTQGCYEDGTALNFNTQDILDNI